MAIGKSPESEDVHANVEVSKDGVRTLTNWKLGKFLGSGGFSWVLQGTKSNGKICALKFTQIVDKRKNFQKYVRQQREIQTELSIVKDVQHENIISLISFRKVNYLAPDGSSLLTYCFALEYCHRVDLFDIIYCTGKFKESLGRKIFQQVAAGLNALHEAGYAHRDIKAQNVLFTDSMVVKLIDFGGSKKICNKLMRTCKVGTRGHQAPELLLKMLYTKQCDVFSLGVLLFILVTGGPPFKEAQTQDPWFRPLCKKPPQYKKFWSNHKRVANLSKRLKSLLEGTMCYQPNGRLHMEDVLAHPWLHETEIPSETYVRQMMERRVLCEKVMGAGKHEQRKNKFEAMY